MLLSPHLVLSECEFVWIALTPKGCLWAQCTSLGSDSSLLWLSWTGLKKSGRQINHVSANRLLGGWAKRKRCLALADHRWEQPRCVHWSQRSSHGQVWAPTGDSWTCAPPVTNLESPHLPLRWNERSCSSRCLGSSSCQVPAWPLSRWERILLQRQATPPVSCQGIVCSGCSSQPACYLMVITHRGTGCWWSLWGDHQDSQSTLGSPSASTTHDSEASPDHKKVCVEDTVV